MAQRRDFLMFPRNDAVDGFANRLWLIRRYYEGLH